MKSTVIKYWIVVLACASTLMVTAKAEDDNEQGGDIQGVEAIQDNILLVATTNAPVGAVGGSRIGS